MFDFLTSEVWWMETIIIAVITGSFTFVASMFGAWAFYNYRLKAIKDDTESLGVGNKELKTEHKELSKEQRELSKELATKVDGIREIIVLEQNEQKHRHENLSSSQKIMVDSINNLKDFATEMEKIQHENIQLKNEIKRLKQRNFRQEMNQEDQWEPEI